MAQLRDAQTSEIMFEGTALECVLLADEIGRDEVLFDDVGIGFDPDAVKKAHVDAIKGLEGVVKNDKGDHVESARESLKTRKAEGSITKKKIDAATKAMKEARAR